MDLRRCARRTVLSGAAALLLAVTADGAPINSTSYGSLTVAGLEDFESAGAAPYPGTNLDAILDLDGSSYAERFGGQTLGTSGLFDTLSGTATGPLALVVGALSQNLVTADLGGDAGIGGLGALGFPVEDANGEGALSVLFDVDSPEFGIEILGANAGSATFQFFRRDGTLIDTVTLLGLTDGFYGFARDAATVDIAGVSITNDDPAGLGFDNVRFRLPEPGSGALIALGVLGCVATGRRRLG